MSPRPLATAEEIQHLAASQELVGVAVDLARRAYRIDPSPANALRVVHAWQDCRRVIDTIAEGYTFPPMPEEALFMSVLKGEPPAVPPVVPAP